MSRRERVPAAQQAGVHRFPPVLQFLTSTSDSTERALRKVTERAFSKGCMLEQICAVLHDHAGKLGYDATIGLQEVFSDRMPSFPGETVWTVLLLVDLMPRSVS